MHIGRLKAGTYSVDAVAKCDVKMTILQTVRKFREWHHLVQEKD